MLGGTLIVLLGFLDDLGNLRPATKLLGQALAVLIVMKAGIAIKIVFLPPFISYPLSFIWLIGMTNAFNIIDIMDGLSSGVAAIACAFLFTIAAYSGQTGLATMILALMGALLGFLRFNYRPARIYLGDAGSLFIGFMLGAIGMVGIYTTVNPVAVLAPILILGVPIFDTLFVMTVRWMRGLNPLKGSPDHFALRLRKWRLSVAQTVLVSYGASLLLGAVALLMVYGSARISTGALLAISLGLMASALWLWKIDMNL
jgi:UDP-GlcNAc:undecaprenyl-phosphate GlcNAc-1-phosphate transferase